MLSYPLNTGGELNVYNTLRRRPGCLLNVLYTFSLHLVSCGWVLGTLFIYFRLIFHFISIFFGFPQLIKNWSTSLLCKLIEWLNYKSQNIKNHGNVARLTWNGLKRSTSNTAWKVSKYEVFSDSYFLAFELNTERCGVSLRIQSKCGKIRTRKTSVFGHFSRSVLVRCPSMILQFLQDFLKLALLPLSFYISSG